MNCSRRELMREILRELDACEWGHTKFAAISPNGKIRLWLANGWISCAPQMGGVEYSLGLIGRWRVYRAAMSNRARSMIRGLA